MDGRGIMTFPNGSVYDGMWQGGIQRGEGTFDDTTRMTTYIGSWQNGKYCSYYINFFAATTIADLML